MRHLQATKKKKRPSLTKRAVKAKIAKTVRKDLGVPRPYLLGNEFWKARSSHGRNPAFATPEDLWNAAQEYFAWNHSNPLVEDNLKVVGGAVVHEPTHKVRAMSVQGLCGFLDISTPTWFEYCQKDGFLSVTARIKDMMYRQKFEGASADLLNANIIARDLGLVDKSERSGNSGPSVVVINADPFQTIWERLAGMMERLDGGQPKKLIER